MMKRPGKPGIAIDFSTKATKKGATYAKSFFGGAARIAHEALLRAPAVDVAHPPVVARPLAAKHEELRDALQGIPEIRNDLLWLGARDLVA